MSLFLDQKYLMLISNRLPLFKKKKDSTYNCRCIICGDSAKNRNKARGYFFSHKNSLVYKCHNCDASMGFASFLKQLDQSLHSQYALEQYSENTVGTPKKPELKFEQPVFKSSSEKILDKVLQRLDKLPEDNEAVEFCRGRKIPSIKFDQLYFIENIKDIVQLNDTYKESIKGEEPRLVLPFHDTDGQLSGVTCRALRGEALRYITVKIKDNVPLIFGMSSIDKDKPVYVVEGPIDSLFIDNCIAVSGTGFGKIAQLGLKNFVVVFDNQPRNIEVCKLVEKNINQGYNVVIWPQTVSEKDINDMVLSGRNVKKIIQDNTFSGIAAKARFMAWKRC